MTHVDAMNFAREPFTEALLAEMREHFPAHWAEITLTRFGDIPPDFDSAFYLGAEASGILRAFTVRDLVEQGRLVGYALFFVRGHPHHAQSRTAVCDMVYVQPSHRGHAGAALVRFAERQLRAEGVQAVYQSVPKSRDWSALLERQGYEAVEMTYVKRLDGKGAGAADAALPAPSTAEG